MIPTSSCKILKVREPSTSTLRTTTRVESATPSLAPSRLLLLSSGRYRPTTESSSAAPAHSHNSSTSPAAPSLRQTPPNKALSRAQHALPHSAPPPHFTHTCPLPRTRTRHCLHPCLAPVRTRLSMAPARIQVNSCRRLARSSSNSNRPARSRPSRNNSSPTSVPLRCKTSRTPSPT